MSSDPDSGEHQVIAPAGDGNPLHSVRPRPTPRRVGAVAGVLAITAAIGLGTTALVRPSDPQNQAPTASGITTADRITVTVPPAAIPLSGPQIAGLLGRPPDYGDLGDATRRRSCLTGLGYPATAPVLGATTVQINNRPGVLLVLQGEGAGMLTALAVAPNCSSANTGLLADTAVAGP